MVKKLMLAGAGLAFLTVEKAKETFDELVARGELTEQEAREVLAQWKTKAQSAKEEWGGRIEQIVTAMITRLDIPTRSELKVLKDRLEPSRKRVKVTARYPLWKPESAAFSGAHYVVYRQIAATLIRYGFGDIVERLHLEPYVAWGRRLLGGKRYHPQEIPPLAERLRLACEELGPTFIKLAQILSTRPDLIPLSIARELARLQDTATPFASAEAKRIVEEELGVPLARVFEEFADRPLAAASIAQVHRARLVTGEDVAVKIQRPGIAETIAIDLTILYHLASLLERYGEEISFYRPTLIVEEFARTVTKELTFLVEAAHAERFARLLSQRPDVQVPQIVRRATTNRVLTMTFMEGIKITDLEGLTKARVRSQTYCRSRGRDLPGTDLHSWLLPCRSPSRQPPRAARGGDLFPRLRDDGVLR